MATTHCTDHGLRVLVVDDDHDTAYSAAKLLSLHGYAARRAHNSQEAISIATAWLPDVALLDLAMPHIDGLQLARSLRKVPGLSRLEFVAVTGLTGAVYRAQAEAEGFRAYLLKPVPLSVLLHVLDDVAKCKADIRPQEEMPADDMKLRVGYIVRVSVNLAARTCAELLATRWLISRSRSMVQGCQLRIARGEARSSRTMRCSISASSRARVFIHDPAPVPKPTDGGPWGF